jgi:type IV pilus assembly protein PilE
MQSSLYISSPAFPCRIGAPARRSRGFTLVELLIVVLVLAILSALAYPMYRDQIRKTRRADAQAVLMQSAQAMERFYTENGTYTGASAPYSKSPIEGTVTYYQITLDIDDDGAGYTLTATGRGPETGVGTMTLDATGLRVGW